MLVSYGADWCVWCHVFKKYVSGEVDRFEYDFDGQSFTMREKAQDPDAAVREAAAVAAFVRENFVLVHIEGDDAPGGSQLLDAVGALERFESYYPYVFVVDQDGYFVQAYNYKAVEIRRNGLTDYFRGYDRSILLDQLTHMREAALAAE